jgi:hypothetical protein
MDGIGMHSVRVSQCDGCSVGCSTSNTTSARRLASNKTESDLLSV